MMMMIMTTIVNTNDNDENNDANNHDSNNDIGLELLAVLLQFPASVMSALLLDNNLFALNDHER